MQRARQIGTMPVFGEGSSSAFSLSSSYIITNLEMKKTIMLRKQISVIFVANFSPSFLPAFFVMNYKETCTLNSFQ